MRLFIAFLISLLLPMQALAETCVCTESISLKLEISAIYPAPLEGESEWVEITNTGEDSVELAFYTLEDANAQPETLSGTLAAGDSIQITDLSFQLNNGGDSVTLRTIEDNWIDTFSYESSSSGEALFKESPEDIPNETTDAAPEISTPSTYPIFSEALPDPAGSDSTDEWIELYNPYDSPLTLDGLYLDDAEGGSSPHELSGTLDAGQYLVLSVEISQLTLNNSSDSVRLLGTEGELLWEIEYDDPDEGSSYAYFETGNAWTTSPTPGKANQLTSESSESESEYADGDLSEDVELSEIYPNPEGPDNEEEWVEITNGGDEAVNLGNWTIDDGEGGSDPYTFPDDTVIEPGETLILYRTESGVALNNSDETVELADYTGEVVDEISYDDCEEGHSLAKITVEEVENAQASLGGLGTRHFTTWEWVQPTPGEANPSWKQFTGTVLGFDGETLSLEGMLDEWNFKVDSSLINELLFQEGNRILVQAAFSNGLYEVMHSELLESHSPDPSRQTPWGLLFSSAMALGWLGYEFGWKRHKAKPMQM